MITNIDLKMNEILLKAEVLRESNIKIVKKLGAELLEAGRRLHELINREKAEEIIDNNEFPEELSQYRDCLVKLSRNIPIGIVDFDKDSWNSGLAKYLLSNFTFSNNAVGFVIYPSHKAQ